MSKHHSEFGLPHAGRGPSGSKWIPAFAGKTAILLILLTGCRGWITEKPPVHPNPNMDTQPKYKPFRESEFFGDKRDMRPLVAGTIARGHLNDDAHFHTGKVNGKLAKTFPKQVVVDHDLLKKGQMKFDIYCAPCHARTGMGDGMVGRRLTIKPRSVHDPRLLTESHGHLFDVITNGYSTMPGYGHQITDAHDRWSIVAYIRALQLSQKPTLKWN